MRWGVGRIFIFCRFVEFVLCRGLENGLWGFRLDGERLMGLDFILFIFLVSLVFIL